MELKPHVGQSPAACVEEICTVLSEFVVKHLRARNVEPLPLNFDGQYTRPSQRDCLVTARYGCAQHTLATLDWEILSQIDSHDACHISCVCAANHQTVEVHYVTQIGPKTLQVSSGARKADFFHGLVMPVDFLNSL